MNDSLERDKLLTPPMVAYELEKMYSDSNNIRIAARFNYQEDNIYFFEKYVNQYYENYDGQPVTWYEFSQYRDLRDDELTILKLLEARNTISNLQVDEVVEEDYAETGRAYTRPKRYSFIANNDYIKILKNIQHEADKLISLNAKLEFVGILTPLLSVGTKSVKLRAINTDTNAGKIIEYCSENSMDKVVKLEEIKKEIALSGVTDIKTSLRGTVFYKGGMLENFVDMNSSRIKLKSNGTLLLEQFKLLQRSA